MTTENQPMLERDVIAGTPSYAHGTVTAVNDRGVQLSGREEWYNLSKFAKVTTGNVGVGMTVMLALDKAGFIRAITESGLPPPGIAKAESNAAYGKPAQRTDEYFYLTCLNAAFTLPLHCDGVPGSIEEYCKLAVRIAKWAQRGEA